MFVDFLAKEAPFKHDKYLLSEITKQDEIILAKPTTFMNKSGDAVRALVKKFFAIDYKLSTNDLIIIHDDLDIPFGKFKIQPQGPKAHNGLTDIQNKLQSMDFLRIRIGVDARLAENRLNGQDYVLQDFTKDEQSELPLLFAAIAKRLGSDILHI